MNDSMGEYVASQVVKLMIKKGIQVNGSRIALLGFTFKENCPDVRNTKVVDIYNALKEYNIDTMVYDPWANTAVAQREYGVEIHNELPAGEKYDAAIVAVAHKEFKALDVKSLLKENSVVYDVKWMLDGNADGKL